MRHCFTAAILIRHWHQLISAEELLSALIFKISITKRLYEKLPIMIESAPDIRYLHRNEIDTEKWDRCIINASNGLIYARSFYLDSMAENWSALVEGDFQNVMPLTWNKKFGFTYLYQPYFTKSLGVFGQNSGPFEISSFLLAIPEKYTYWD